MITCETCKNEFRPDGQDGQLLEITGQLSVSLGEAHGAVICAPCLDKTFSRIARDVCDVDSTHAAVNDIYTALDEGYITAARAETHLAHAARALLDSRITGQRSAVQVVAAELDYMEGMHGPSKEEYVQQMRDVVQWATAAADTCQEFIDEELASSEPHGLARVIAHEEGRLPCDLCKRDSGELLQRADWPAVNGCAPMVCSECAPFPEESEELEGAPVKQVSYPELEGAPTEELGEPWRAKERKLAEAFTGCGGGADWCVSAWHVGPGQRANCHDGDYYIIDPENPNDDINDVTYLLVRYFLEDDNERDEEYLRPTVAASKDIDVLIALAKDVATNRAVPFKVGDRVRFTRVQESYPHAWVNVGETGVVVEEGEGFAVKLDSYHDGLDEWGNRLEWYRIGTDECPWEHPLDCLELTRVKEQS